MNTTFQIALESILNQREISEEVKNNIIKEDLLHIGTLKSRH
jgi:hypothetical protein